MSKVSKVIISSRIHPYLKEDLDDEAEISGMTTSKYLEQIIENRFNTSDDDNSDESDTIAQLESKIQNLESVNENMSTRLDAYENEYEELNDQFELLQEASSKVELEPKFPIKLREPELKLLIQLLEKLRRVHSKTPDSLLLLGALDTTLRTESAIWMIPTINKFIKRQKRAS